MNILKLILATLFLLSLFSCSSNTKPNFNTSNPPKTSRFAQYDIPPKAIKRVPPTYPEFVKKMGIEGEVLLDVELLASGKVREVKVVKSLMSGPGGLDEVAIKAVKQWEFEPAMHGGEPVACRITFPITFSLQKNSALQEKPIFKHPEGSTSVPENERGITSKYAVYEIPPEVIKTVNPVYPKLYQRKGIQGNVWLLVEILDNGLVGEVEVAESLDSSKGGLDDCAVNAVKQWVFKPSMYDDQPVACWVKFPVSFRL